ncbi:MAG: ribonuclease H-like domain-containing protein, partial [Bdellovibrionales bacterium]|nr:ribonuclease H-like domain-containing protein [Bdellovibrionales bacterium]
PMSAPSTATRIRLNPSFWRHRSCVPFSEDIVPSSLFLRNRHYLVVDIETQNLVQDVGGWDHVDKLKISVACAYDSKDGQYKSYLEHQIPELIELCSQRLVVGYNIRGFDLLVLKAYGLDPAGLDVFDIMYDLETLTRQRFLKLEYVARGSLGTGKSADGLQAVEWWKQGEVQKIIEYCLQDVKVTQDVFQYGRQNGFVKIQRSEDAAKATSVPVSWN